MKKDSGSKRGKLFSFISVLCATAMLVQCAPMTGLAEEIGKPASAAVTYSTPADTTTDESAKSGQVQLTTQDLINAPLLTAPTNLSASSITNTGLTLSWTASTGTVSVAGYTVYCNGVIVGNCTGTQFNISGLTQDSNYTLAVMAYDANGDKSDCSEIINVKTLSDFNYSVNSNGTLTITGYKGSSRNIVIPSTIDGAVVSAIGDNAFLGTSIESVVISQGIKSIGGYSFFYCTCLKSVDIPSSVTSIGGEAFSRCYQLTTVNLVEGLTTIGNDAFGYSGLSVINLPNSLKTIGSYAFECCGGLKTITIPGNAAIGSEAFYGSGLTSATLQEGITSTGEFAFYGCSALKSISLPSTLKQIAWYTFHGCSSLTSITIPSYVTSVGEQAFYGCSNLTSVTNFCCSTSYGPSVFYGVPANLTLHAFGRSTTNTFATNNSIHFAPLALNSIAMQSSPNKTNYVVGESLDLTGATIKLTYNSGDTQVSPIDQSVCDVSTFDCSGTKPVNVKIGNCSTCFYVNVTNPVNGITQLPATIALSLNNTRKLNLTVTNDNSDDKTILWNSSDNSIVSVDSNGNIAGLKVGTSTITATSADGVYSTSCIVTVSVVNVTGVALQSTNSTLEIGNALNLTATIFPTDASNKGLTWSTSDSNIATVDSNGVVTAKAVGSVTITVTTRDGSKTAACHITVVVPITSISISGNNAITVNGTTSLTATILPTNATNKNVTWSSNNPSIISVDQSGNVKGISRGTAAITASATDGSGITASFSVTVNPPAQNPVPTKIDSSGYTDMFAAAIAAEQKAQNDEAAAQTNLNNTGANLPNLQQDSLNQAARLLVEQAKLVAMQAGIDAIIAYIQAISSMPGEGGAVLDEAFVLIDEESAMLDETETIISIEQSASADVDAVTTAETATESFETALAQAQCDAANANEVMASIAPDAVSTLNNASIAVDSYADYGIIDEASANAAANALNESISSDTIKSLVDYNIDPVIYNDFSISGEGSADAVIQACSNGDLDIGMCEITDATTGSEQSVLDVSHAVGSADQAQSVLNGINPVFFKKTSRFGAGLYLGTDADTIIAELAQHNVVAKYAISYDMDLTEQNVLDLTDPAVAAKWNFISGVSSESECQVIGAEAQSEGYNVIKVQSYRGSGINYIIFNEFGNILQARNVTPID